MAKLDSASIITLVQPAKRPLTGAERARNYRLRKKAAQANGGAVAPPPPGTPQEAEQNARPSRDITLRVTPSRVSIGVILIRVAAYGLAAVGITMNGYYAMSLGATDVAGDLFLALGIGADLAGVALPSRAAQLWTERRWPSSIAAWAIFGMTLAFALNASLGFASLNIADVTLSRASRATPSVTAAQVALDDAKAARDRECKGGVGKFCREREGTVRDRQAALDVATQAVAHAADPQTDAAIHMTTWLSRGLLRPSGDDFGMFRLGLFAALAQIGGLLLMLGRTKMS